MPPVTKGKAMPTKVTGPKPLVDLRHDDTRANIPTGETAAFAPDADAIPAVRYPRDPSLDPQLVWRGKDEQDSADLEVPSVPIYVQEKVIPRAIIEDLRRPPTTDDDAPDLFADFDGIPNLAERVDFYRHPANWSNRLILGDSLLAMTSLADREGMCGKVQMIYIDPPYGIKFGSNWQVSTRKRVVADGKPQDATRQPEQVKAFRDTWELGIHSYLSYLRDRLVVARELLTDSGSVFVQIGDENVHLVRSIMDEVFGAENLINQITFRKTGGATSAHLAGVVDYLLWYGKSVDQLKFRRIYWERMTEDDLAAFSLVMDENGVVRPRTQTDDDLPRLRHNPLTSQRPPGDFPVLLNGTTYSPGKGYWKTNPEGMNRLGQAGRLLPVGNTLEYIRFVRDFPAATFTALWGDTATSGFGEQKRYVVQTNSKVIARCLLLTTDPGDLVLDPTCGSGTTAYVAEQWGRRWITTDTSRVALTLARTRLMSAKLPYYLLADSPEGRTKEGEIAGVPANTAGIGNRVDRGFVYKRVPHVTLKSIANNPDIHEGMSRNAIDAAIARHADTELLYDQPYEDSKRVRVAGPFTVESLAPHTAIREPEAAVAAPAPTETYEQTLLDNLRKAGIQNGWRDDRLTFDRIEAFPGRWIQAVGHTVGAPGTPERVGIALGPQYGTVDRDLVEDAAKEAVHGVSFDLLLVCGFAFDSYASETAKEFSPVETKGFAVAQTERRFGRLPVLLVHVNPDLAMGDNLLKATGAGNLFTVFGEPDITIDRTDDGIVVEIHGVDVYDPTTGTVRSSSTDDIACWFIDTEYDGESFFVRHAYFTGADEPYTRLSRALKSDIDADAWASLYRTRSRPFPVPTHQRIAVKVISHYGDEVLQVYWV